MKGVKLKEPAWRDKCKAGNLMCRVLKHANGEVEMTSSQLKAAEIYLRKTVPDLSRTELTGKDGKEIEHKITSESDKQILARYYQQQEKK